MAKDFEVGCIRVDEWEAPNVNTFQDRIRHLTVGDAIKLNEEYKEGKNYNEAF